MSKNTGLGPSETSGVTQPDSSTTPASVVEAPFERPSALQIVSERLGLARLPKRRRAQLVRWVVYLLTVVGVAYVVSLVDWAHVQDSMFNPDIARDQFPDIITRTARNTLIFTAYGFSGALVIGLFLALMRLSSIRPYRWFAIGYIELFRGLPALLTIFFIGFAMPIALGVRVPGPAHATGGLALAVVFGAYIAEILRAGVEAVPKGQMEAARSLGMGHTRAMLTIVVPQAFRMTVPPLTNELVMLLKDTSLLAILGVRDETREVMKFGRDAVGRTSNATPLIVAGLVYLAMTIPLTRLAALLERRWRRSR